MNNPLIIFSIILFLLAFLVGVKKQTWLLSGFNYQRVHDQEKLAKLTGIYNLFMAIIFFVCAMLEIPEPQILFVILVLGYIVLIGYVNIKMVK